MLLFDIKTIQASVFRNLIEALKDIFVEINLIVNKNGVSAITIDNSRTVLASLLLNHDKFETFVCNVDRDIVIGIDMIHFFKIIRTMQNNEILNMTMNDKDNNIMHIRIENPESNMITTYKLKLMDIKQSVVKIPKNIEFDVFVSMQSTLFLKIIKEMNNFSKVVEIKSLNNELIFSCAGIIADRETILKESDGGLNIVRKTEDNNKIVQCLFLLKMLFAFTKCTHLSNSVELQLKNDFALICKYYVGSLGELQLILSNYKNEE